MFQVADSMCSRLGAGGERVCQRRAWESLHPRHWNERKKVLLPCIVTARNHEGDACLGVMTFPVTSPHSGRLLERRFV